MADASRAQREWRVTGMDCGACAAKVRGAVERLPGVADVDVALMSERLRLTLDESETAPERIEKAVRGIGFGISPKGAKAEKPKGGFILPDDAVIGGAGAVPQASAPEETADPAWYQTTKGRLSSVPALCSQPLGSCGLSYRGRFPTGPLSSPR